MWWLLLLLRAVLPAVFAIGTGFVVSAVESHGSLAAPLAFVGVTFVVLQVLPPVHQAVGANLGSRASAWLNDRLMMACGGPTSCRQTFVRW